jgi:outer membrane immunogenic protein
MGCITMRTAFNTSLAVLGLLMVPMAASAADISVKPPPAAVPASALPPFSWTGFFIGGSMGGGWASGNVADSVFGLSASRNHSGFIGGSQLGFNYQFNRFVLGAEGDFSATGNNLVVPLGGDPALQASANTQWLAMLAARFGVAYDRFLLYGKAGGGWAENNATITNLVTSVSVSASNTNTGWLVGGGIEWAFLPNWSAKVEYDYVGLRGWNFASALLPNDTFAVNRNIQMFAIGVNYKLEWDNSVTARY